MVHAALVVGSGVAANVLFAAMFVARVVAPRRAHALGLAGTAMAVPLAVASGIAAASGDPGWEVALPLVFVAFAAIEVLVDVIGAVDVRATRWLWAYLLAFYVAQWAVIGAAFLADERAGYAVLASYFVTLAATAWSFRRVGHGAAAAGGVPAARGPGVRPAAPGSPGAPRAGGARRGARPSTGPRSHAPRARRTRRVHARPRGGQVR